MTITIDGTEVICSNDITIKQEMLNTPSVILNNVYPKTWESDKDYTSRFYHPDDYSQCIISDGVLPNEYQQVEYIENTGTSYINTGVKPCMNKIRCVCDMAPMAGADTAFFGSRGTYYLFYNVGSNYFWPISKCETIQGTLTVGNKYHVDWNKGTLEVTGDDGVYEKGVRSNNTQDSYTMNIFTFNPLDGRRAKAKIYNFQIYFDDVLVRDFIPCYRRSDNEVGMYDLVEGTFYTNQGGDSFSCGSDVNIPLFCGVVKNSGQISLNPRFPHYSTLQILDYKTFLSEGETLDVVIADKTVLEAINQVVDIIAPYGFELGNVSIIGGDDVIGAYSTKDKTAYDVFNYLADITQSRWTTRVLGTGRVAIDFYDPTLMPSGTAIDYTTTWFKNNDIIDISYNYGTWDYRNKQVMTSRQVYGSISQLQTILYDGYATQIMTEFPIGRITSIYVNGVGRPFSTNEEKAIGLTADFYYTPGNNYFERNMSINVGSEIVINYVPIVEGRQVVNNANEISRVASATGVKGVVARYENRNDATTSTELQKIGQSYIKYKGVPEINLTIKTRSNLWEVGQRVQFNAPITELDTEYMVKRKEINYIVTADEIFYTFELCSSFNSESAINYFDNQRSKTYGNIAEGEFISRNVDIENEATIIFYDTTATSISISSNNELQTSLQVVLGG